MTKLADRMIAAETAAADLINIGRGTKTQIKNVKDLLSRAFDEVKKQHHDASIQIAVAKVPNRNDNEVEWAKYWDELNALEIPYTLAHLREAKHKDRLEVTGNWEAAKTLMETLAAVKEVEVVAREVKEVGQEELIKQAVLKSFKEIVAERRAQFDWATAIIRVAEEINPGFKALPISVNHVYCANYHGTHWVRIDWFLRGRKTPFNVIAAAVDVVKHS